MPQNIGIDYGAQRAGTTRVCTLDKDRLILYRSIKRQSADDFVLGIVKDLAPSLVSIDAPLSLPLAYYGDSDDYHYRASDRVLSAMSPMFLGGLTARAMSLRNKLNIPTIEVYPAARVRTDPSLASLYKKKDKNSLPTLVHYLNEQLEYDCINVQDYHDIDSILSWWIGTDFLNKKAKQAGMASEGIIYY